MSKDVQVINELTIANVGANDLLWTIEESASGNCDATSDIPWVSLSVSDGSTPSGTSADVDVTFDSTGQDFGANSGALCISSNDGESPLVTVPVSMNVVKHIHFLAIVASQN
jgi:hypothetical protein